MHQREPGRNGNQPDQARSATPGPRPAPARLDILTLQRLAGNAAVTKLLTAQRHVQDETCAADSSASSDPATPEAVQRSAVSKVLSSPGRPMEASVRSEMEQRLGADFSSVRLHDDTTARTSAAELGARAYTSGEHVVIGEGGRDRHTLAHELTHVIQQRQGPVAGTDNGGGLRVSDPSDRFEREAEANARTAMSRPAPTPDVQRAADARAHEESPTVQRAQGAESVQRAPGSSTPPASQNPGTNAAFVITPQQQQALALAVMENLGREYIDRAIPELSNWATGSDEAFPYTMMSQNGRMWEAARWETEPTSYVGRALVADKSSSHMGDMSRERGSGKEWHQSVQQKMEAALKERMLRHYTPSDRVTTMLQGGRFGEMKSKQKLLAENPTADHNTGGFDEQDLANDGFVFFFIEKKDAPFRNTRFTQGSGGPARITLPIDRLIQSGWIMMNDFLDLEYPTLRSDSKGSLLSYRRDDNPAKPTSPEKKMQQTGREIGEIWKGFPDLDKKARDLAAGLSGSLAGGTQSFDTEDMIELIRARKDIKEAFKAASIDKRYHELADRLKKEFAQSVQYDRQVRRFKPAIQRSGYMMGGEMRYMHGEPGEKSGDARRKPDAIKRHKEHLRGNILAGAHIIPGLASRGVLEISRIEAQGGHEALVKRMKEMPGDALVDMLLKDFIRPQAMIPWSVAISRGDVEYL
ncbi:eCIS core domain-containing protein [Streptomyces sp. NPDC055078]